MLPYAWLAFVIYAWTTLNNYYRKITYLQLKKVLVRRLIISYLYKLSFFIFGKYWSFVLETKFTTEILLVPGHASFKKLLARKGKLTTRTTRTAYFRTPVVKTIPITRNLCCAYRMFCWLGLIADSAYIKMKCLVLVFGCF